MSVIICDKCGDSVDTTAKSVSLPFECENCQETAQKYEDMAPSSLPRTAKGNFLSAMRSPEAEPLTDEFATVENTTLLIMDLEEQVARAEIQARVYSRLLRERDKTWFRKLREWWSL